MTLEDLNQLSAHDAESEFLKCCGAQAWAQAMAAGRPFVTKDELFARAEDASKSLADEDWLEAFRAHPKIGQQKASTVQTQQEQGWSSQEQSAMQSASADTVAQLRAANHEYEARFGFIFIVCASGKSSGEMLTILNNRLNNDRQTELWVAAQEQEKITRLRLEKLLNQ
jgi:OHCU decarboxylase